MSYCEHCEGEYPGLTCPVCGSKMLQEVDPETMPAEPGGWTFGVHSADELSWPQRPDGEPEEPVALTVCPDFLSYGAVTISRLKAEGIPVMTRYPKAGGLGKLYTGISGAGVELLVPLSMLHRAKGFLLPPEDGEDEGGA